MKDLTLPLVQTIGVPFMGPLPLHGSPVKTEGYVPPHRSFSEGVSPVKNGGKLFFLFQVHSKALVWVPLFFPESQQNFMFHVPFFHIISMFSSVSVYWLLKTWDPGLRAERFKNNHQIVTGDCRIPKNICVYMHT